MIGKTIEELRAGEDPPGPGGQPVAVSRRVATPEMPSISTEM